MAFQHDLTLSCAHLTWPELFQILTRIQSNDLTYKQVDTLSCNERCWMINLNPVVVCKHAILQENTLMRKHSSLNSCLNSLMLNQLVK